MRDPVIGVNSFLHEAVAALTCLLIHGTALSRLVFLVLHVMLKNDGGRPPRQSDLDTLQALFAEALDEAES
jgi:hypothetical protein